MVGESLAPVGELGRLVDPTPPRASFPDGLPCHTLATRAA